MQFKWSEMIHVIKFRKVVTLAFIVIGIMLIILMVHIGGIVYYYRDYFALLLPDPPLPVMKRPTPDVGPNGDNSDASNVPSRILCLIATSPNYHEKRASHVDATWARHCTKSVFLTTERDDRLSHVVLTPGAASYEQLWSKVTQGFEWAYDHRDEYDWFYKADDDTFTVIENLQAALAHLDPDQPQATGNHLRTWKSGSTYLNGGAGYVLSRGALIKLVKEGLRKKACESHLQLRTNEDVNMSDCLTYLGVELLDSRDSKGRQRFNVYPPSEIVDPRQANHISHLWLKKVSAFPYKFGFTEMSDEVISFHYVDAKTMYLLYYLIYFVNPINSNLLQTHQPFQQLHQQNEATESKLKNPLLPTKFIEN